MGFAAQLPLRFFDPRRIDLPVGGRFRRGGRVVLEDEAAEVLKTLKKPQLSVRVKATSSGVLINRRVYPGARMQDSVHHFLKDYGKPFLDRHPSHGKDEPKIIGRVTSAEYVQVWSDKAWVDDWKNPRPNGHPGSGHIVLDATITDLDEIERVIDKRLMTLSVGFRPTAYFCSICAHDWVADGQPCGHEMGKHYDDEKGKGRRLAYGITGNLIYDHIAGTGFPADPTSQILSSRFNDALDCLTPQEDAVPTRLAAFVLTDASGDALELELESTESRSASPEAPVVVGALPDIGRLLQENAMKHADGSEEENEAQTSDPNAETQPLPKEGAGEGEGKSAEGEPAPEEQPSEGSEGAAEGTPAEEPGDSASDDQMLDVNGNWTMPDPVDGHVHELMSLDKLGNGRTSSVKGTKIPAHDHPIEEGRLRATSGDNYISRHPGTFFFDAAGKTWKFQDGKKIEVNLNPTDDEDCGDECYAFEQDEALKSEWVVTTEMANAVDKLDADELSDMIEETELIRAGQLEDAALTTEQRKKIPTTLFCGPGRSFPVNDKPRVRNALSRLPQSTRFSPAQKARILACIKRRAKQLGVDVGGESKKDAVIVNDPAADTIVKTLAKENNRLEARVRQLEGAAREQDAEIRALQEENQQLTQRTLEQLVDRVMDLKLALRSADVRELDTKDKITEFRNGLAKRSVASLADTAKDLQLELARGHHGVRLDPSVDPPKIDTGHRGGAPAAGKDQPKSANLAVKTLAELSGK